MARWSLRLRSLLVGCALAILSLGPILTEARLFWLSCPTPLSVIPWAARRGHAVAATPQRLMLTAGSGAKEVFNDVWSYTPTAGWSALTPGPFLPREDHSLVSVGGSVFLFAGAGASGVLNDVYALSAGASAFTLVTSAAPWGARRGASSAVLGETVYLVAGKGAGKTVYADVWSWSPLSTSAYSSPWLSLTPASPESSPWILPRHGAGLVRFNNSLLIVAGASSTGVGGNDVSIWDGVNREWGSLMPGSFIVRSYASVSTISLPSPSSSSSSTGGSGVQHVILVGGQTDKGPESGSYSFDGSAWGSVGGSDSFPGRSHSALVSSPFTLGRSKEGESLVLLAGVDRAGMPLADCWVLKDLSPPTPPREVRARAIQSLNETVPSNSVEITWLPPLDSGGIDVEEVEVRNDFDDLTLLVNSSSIPTLSSSPTPLLIIFPHLSYPFNYTFSIRARSMAGWGGWSAASNVIATAEGGWKIDGGGRIGEEGFGGISAGASKASSSDLTTKGWFISLLISLSVLLFVSACFLLVRSHLSKANRTLARLDEIERLHDVDGEVVLDSEHQGEGVADLNEVGLGGIGRRRKQDELDAWKRGVGEAPPRFGAKAAKAGTLDPTLVAPLGFKLGGEEDQVALDRLGEEMARLDAIEAAQQAKSMDWSSMNSEAWEMSPASPKSVEFNLNKWPTTTGTTSIVAAQGPPTDKQMRGLCESAASALVDQLQAEFARMTASDSKSASGMMAAEGVRETLAHAFFASGVLRHLSTSSRTHSEARADLRDSLFQALLPEVSLDAAEKRALVMAIESDGAGQEQHLFLLARARMLQWMFERVKAQKERLGEDANAKPTHRHGKHAGLPPPRFARDRSQLQRFDEEA